MKFSSNQLTFLFTVFLSVFILGSCSPPDSQQTYSPVRVAILDSGINDPGNIEKSYNTFTKSSDTNDEFNHGTKIFNVIKKYSPKNQKSTFYDIQVLNKNGQGTANNICLGIKKAIDFKADIISMSLGFNNDNSTLKKCVANATSKGIIVIAASGDTLSKKTDYPAKYSNVISVAAVDKKDQLFSFSSTGKIDFVANGVNISTVDSNGEETLESGSSIAVASFLADFLSNYKSNINIEKIKKEKINIKGRYLEKVRYNEI